MRLPDQFYQGIHLGVCGWDEWGVKVNITLVLVLPPFTPGDIRIR